MDRIEKDGRIPIRVRDPDRIGTKTLSRHIVHGVCGPGNTEFTSRIVGFYTLNSDSYSKSLLNSAQEMGEGFA